MNIEDIVRNAPVLLAAVMISILFIQSGLDKVFDWKGNMDWLTGHFSKTFLAPMVPLLLGVITLMEIAAGLLAAAGIIYFLLSSSLVLIFWAAVIAALALLSLFFGQRIAKDYPGAVSIVPYFIIVLIVIFLSGPNRTP